MTELKLNTRTIPIVIEAKKLKDGDIAVILDGCYTGTIVQRYGEKLVSLGKGVGQSWMSVCVLTFMVRLLEPGESIEIV